MRTTAIVIAALLLAAVSASAPAQAACQPPRVLIVLDKSSSMLGKVSGKTKWSIAKTALAKIFKKYKGNIDFGLMLFPYPNQCGPGHVYVDVGPNRTDLILKLLTQAPPPGGNWTPMAQSLMAAGKVSSLLDKKTSNHVLLITDGWQWCDPYDIKTRFYPVNSVGYLTNRKIKTHVVGFGGGVDALTLNKMAAIANNKRTAKCNVNSNDSKAKNNCYYQANSPSELLTALSTIAQKISQEVCDGKDNNCNGKIDDNLTAPLCKLQKGVCKGATPTCGGTSGWGSCSATNYQVAAKSASSTYEAKETKCDGDDNDCDGTIDEGCSCTDGKTRKCGSAKGVCANGTQTCTNGKWGTCSATGSKEICDGKDNDCDGTVDEGVTRTCKTKCGSGVETCSGGKFVQCTAQKPGTEYCDGFDNDCDGVIDGPTAICANGGTCVNGSCKQAGGDGGGDQVYGGDRGGCDCELGGEPPVGGMFALLLLGLVALFRHRRRASRQ